MRHDHNGCEQCKQRNAISANLLTALIGAYEAAPFHESGCPREEDTEEVAHIAKGCDCILSVMQGAITAAQLAFNAGVNS